jgi:DNA-binding MarR family transcriptional regulator
MSHELTRIDKKAGTLEVLVALYAAGELKMTELCRTIHLDRGTVAGAVAILEELRLLTLRSTGQFPFARQVVLSPLGGRLVRSPLVEWPSILFEQDVDRFGTESIQSRNRGPDDSRSRPLGTHEGGHVYQLSQLVVRRKQAGARSPRSRAGKD